MEHGPPPSTDLWKPFYEIKIHRRLLVTDFLCEDAGPGMSCSSEAVEAVLWRARPQV